MQKDKTPELDLAARVARLEAAIRSVTQHISGQRAVRFDWAPELASICGERWPNLTDPGGAGASIPVTAAQQAIDAEPKAAA